ncbi:MAG: methyltransferase domain-containing protein [Pseudomonadota bacterium]
MDATSNYYDAVYDSYKLGWSADHLHTGMWDEATHSHQQSLINTIDRISDALDIQTTDRVLDAGCGVGGAARYLAERTGCSVHGITYSHVLLAEAQAALERYPHPDRVQCHFMDFADTSFADASFTKVFALESVSHGRDKHAFAKEAFRLLEPGGRLVVSDGFLLRSELSAADDDIYQRFLEGWALPYLANPEAFVDGLKQIGFVDARFEDRTADVMRSVRYMHRNARMSRHIYRLLHAARMTSKARYLSAESAYLYRLCIDRGIMGYGFALARKPE